MDIWSIHYRGEAKDPLRIQLDPVFRAICDAADILRAANELAIGKMTLGLDLLAGTDERGAFLMMQWPLSYFWHI